MQRTGRLELTWVGKYEEKVIEPRILLEDNEKSYGDPTSENMLIHGDNLIALQSLQQDFAGRVKCIYIDPPYNTGSAFEYYDDGLEHSEWLQMMAPRLRLLRNLLSDDGSIWIQIDDEEQAYLKVMCDEIFGRQNFVNMISVNMKNIAGASGGGEDRRLKKNCEYILIYAKNYDLLDTFRAAYDYEEISELVTRYKEEGISWKYTSVFLDEGEKQYIASTVDGDGNEIKIFEHKNYILKSIGQGLEAEMGKPKVYDGENYDTYPIKYHQQTLFVEKTSEIQLFIFNIGKIFNSKTDTQFNFHKFKETLGASFADVLAQFDDLVICMDEAHRYYAPASMKAINYLKPVLGLEFTATPKSTTNIIYSYDLARGAVEGYLKIPVVMGRSNMAGYSQDDIEEMKIRDGLTLHEHRKTVLREYCSDNDLDYVKPIVLIACKDTEHAKKIRALIDNDAFLNGKYKGKVIEIHSKQTGEESEENIRLLQVILPR